MILGTTVFNFGRSWGSLGAMLKLACVMLVFQTHEMHAVGHRADIANLENHVFPLTFDGCRLMIGSLEKLAELLVGWVASCS